MGEEQQIPSTSSGQAAGLTDQVAWTVKESINPAQSVFFYGKRPSASEILRALRQA